MLSAKGGVVMADQAQLEPHYTAREVAESWRVSEDTVYRKFRDMPGVLQIPARVLKSKRKRAPKVLLRIPASLLRRLQQEWSGGFRPEVELRRR